MMQVKHWIITATMMFVFFTGWYTRGIYELADKEKELVKKIRDEHIEQNRRDEQGAEAEAIIAKINEDAYNLNQILRKTYVDSTYRCPIPADGLRILAEASR